MISGRLFGAVLSMDGWMDRNIDKYFISSMLATTLVFHGVLCPSRMLGAVVVGIGTAGRVRIRDMLAALPGSPAEKVALRGFVSR